MIKHPIEPIYNASSKILILGSFPSVKSREDTFFYAHLQNRFWCVISEVLGREAPRSTEEKRELLLSSGIALWDVIASCDITGSSDATIKNAVPNDISKILSAANISALFVNGSTAEKYYNAYLLPKTGRSACLLPSTYPANAGG